jgi:nucleoside phosphorylase/tetratricopeptide (TPR) repeat protein
MPCAVILTTLSVEYMAVRCHLADLQEEMHPQGTIYERGKFVADKQTWEVGIAEVEAGNSGVAIEVERAIAYFRPDILLFVGIAGGLKDVAIGDVVAATKVYAYESGKAEERFFTRPALGRSAYALEQRAKSEAKKEDWLKRLSSNPPSRPRVFVAPIAAGESVIGSGRSNIFQFLRESYNDATAVDMAGFGCLNAAFAHYSVQAIVVRGISNLVENGSDDSEEEGTLQTRASNHASAFAFEILSKLPTQTTQSTLDTKQNEEEFQQYPVAVDSENVYIMPQIDPSGDESVVSYTIEELTKENYHNLPTLPHKQLIGREEDLKELLTRISPNFYERTITVVGIGGVGKTSLVLEAAYACLAAKKEISNVAIPTFDVIVFSSAQVSALSPQGVIEIDDTYKPIRTLQDLCVDIANTLEQSGLKALDPSDQISGLQSFLSSEDYKILIILDNLETLEYEDTHQIYEFLKKIKGNHIKTVVTTRSSERYDLSLKELSDSASLQMIDHLLVEVLAEGDLVVDDNFRHDLNRLCGGVPLAIQYAIGVMAIERDPQKVLEKLSDPQGELSQYCFDRLIQEIKVQNPIGYKILVVLSVSPYGITRENLFYIAEISNLQQEEASHALTMLSKCSLVFYDNGYHKMLPLTRRYLLSRLENDSNLESEIRESWVSCYLEIARLNGGEDRGEWHIKYDVINNEWKNFKEVFSWCKNRHKYEEARSLWKSLSRFAYLYGYWSDRLEWSYWLMDVAFQIGDNSFLAEVRSACAWLTLLREGEDNLQRAEVLLKEAWNLKEYCDPYIRNIIAINLAVLFTRKKDFKRADHYFKKYMELRKEGKRQRKESKDEKTKFNENRLEIRYLLYWGEKYYRENDYRKAKQLYQQVIKKSEDIEWLRFKVKAYERLAYIAISENRLVDAETLLEAWYPVTQRNRDYRRMAFFERDYAELEVARGNHAKAKVWAGRALKKFQDLNMLIRVETINELIKKCDAQLTIS